jgi:hypothetical protein
MSESVSPAEFPDTGLLRCLVDDYCSTQRHPTLVPFSVHGPFTRDGYWTSDAAKKPGCYVIYGEDGSLRYIGASETSVHNRISDHLQPARQETAKWSQGSPAAFIVIIAVTEPWEVLSLERYLQNKTGVAAKSHFR